MTVSMLAQSGAKRIAIFAPCHSLSFRPVLLPQLWYCCVDGATTFHRWQSGLVFFLIVMLPVHLLCKGCPSKIGGGVLSLGPQKITNLEISTLKECSPVTRVAIFFRGVSLTFFSLIILCRGLRLCRVVTCCVDPGNFLLTVFSSGIGSFLHTLLSYLFDKKSEKVACRPTPSVRH